MAKASKTVATVAHTVNGDSAIIARDFATFGQFTVNNDARTALLRRVTDAETFKAIRLTALAAWLVQKGYNEKEARENVDGTLANPKAFGKGAKRTDAQQIDYKRAGAAWQYYLECNGVASLTRAPSSKPATRAPRTPMGANVPNAPLADNSAKAPPAALSAVVPVRGDMVITVDQFANCAALMGRIVNANSKNLKGDKGASLRTLAEYVAKEVARIQALKD